MSPAKLGCRPRTAEQRLFVICSRSHQVRRIPVSHPRISPSPSQRADEVCDQFEKSWEAGQRPQIEEYLGALPEPQRSACLRKLLSVELAYRRRSGETLVSEEYRQRFPSHGRIIVDLFREAEQKSKPHLE